MVRHTPDWEPKKKQGHQYYEKTVPAHRPASYREKVLPKVNRAVRKAMKKI